MSDNATRSPLLRALGLATMLCGFAPIYLLCGAETLGEVGALLPLVFGALCFPVSLLGQRPRRLLLAALCLGAAAYGWLAPGQASQSGMLRALYALLCAALPVVALPSLYRAQLLTELPVGVVATLVCWLIWRGPAYRELRATVFRSACAFLPLLLLYVNLSQLESQRRAQKGGRPAGLLSANIVLTCALGALAFLAANAKAIWTWMEQALATLIRWFFELMALLAPAAEEEPSGGGGAGEPMTGPAEIVESSPFWKIMEIVAIVIASLAALYALFLLCKRLPALLRKIGATLKRLTQKYLRAISAEGGDYVDNTEDLRADEERVNANRGKRRKRARLPRWSDMDNRRRMRAVYRRAVEGKTGILTRTARENLLETFKGQPDEARALASGYERARYSDHDISDAEVEAARAALPRGALK